MKHFGKHSRLKKVSGQALVEYCVCAGAVLLICVVGFQIFGGNLAGWFALLKEDMGKNTQHTVQAKAGQSVLVGSAGNAGGQGQPSVMNNALSSIQNAQAESAKETIDVAGSNGTTAAYATDILAKAKQSLDSGNLSQDEYDMVVKLANKGHDIAKIQGLLENAFSQSQGNSSAYANTALNFNGQTYTPSQLNSVLETSITDFSTLKSQASTLNGVLYDTTLLTTINDSGAQIINNGYSSKQQNQTADSFIQYQSGGATGGSTDTHQESAVICTNGDHQDSGTQCAN